MPHSPLAASSHLRLAHSDILLEQQVRIIPDGIDGEVVCAAVGAWLQAADWDAEPAGRGGGGAAGGRLEGGGGGYSGSEGCHCLGECECECV